MDLLCGFVPRASIETALGRSDLTATGGKQPASSPRPDGTTFERASCAVTVPGGGQTPAFSVEVVPLTGDAGAGIIRTARLGTAQFTYPDSVGVGFASYGTYHDAKGREYRTCESGLLRGDWMITLGIELPGPGRNVLDDTVAVAQEIVDTLRLPLKPTRPYPAAAASGVPTSTPS